MFTNWSNRGRLHIEEKTSLVLEILVILRPAKKKRRETEVWRKAKSYHWNEPGRDTKQKRC